MRSVVNTYALNRHEGFEPIRAACARQTGHSGSRGAGRAVSAWGILTACLGAAAAAQATEFHVATTGDDSNPGAAATPLRTIQRAADLAQPGDTVTVHAGTYRERVNPPRGGASDARRIVYQAAPGETVEIKGSERVTGWEKAEGETWKLTLPDSYFGDFNPFADEIRGDWFNPRGRKHHTGAVYLNGDWLTEAATLDEVLLPAGTKPAWLTGNDQPEGGKADTAGVVSRQLWFAEVDATNTTLWAQFAGLNPNEQCVEINVRQTVFYPDQPGRNFITVRGFSMGHAATPWAPPTAEQIGLIGTHWSKGWIIENNIISHSVCVGIALGKHGDRYDNTSADTAEGYVKTIERAHAHPMAWIRENIGHHVVRNNIISHCEQAGIVGSLGAAFSTIEGNVIHDIHVRRLFSGAEMAGIKLHAAIDSVIRNNHIYLTARGLWLDWMAQGTRVSRNLFHDNIAEDLFVEVNHGPFLVDNNLLLSATSLLDMSEGGAYAHNLFGGRITNRPEPSRETPYHPAHSTMVAGLAITTGGDDRFYNNLFMGDGQTPSVEQKGNLGELRWISSHGLWGYDGRSFPLQTGGNVYYHGAQPYAEEENPLVLPDQDPAPRLEERDGHVYLYLSPGESLRQADTRLVTTKQLGETRVSRLPYVNPDGSPLQVNRDYFGKRRGNSTPTPGPFQTPGRGELVLQIW